MEQNLNKEELNCLIDFIISKGNRPITFEGEKAINKLGFGDELETIRSLEQSAFYADAHENTLKELKEVEKKWSSLADKISSSLKEMGYDIPIMMESKKNESIKSALKDFGFSDEEVNKFIENDIDIAETTGKRFELNFKNEDNIKKVLQDKGIDFQEEGDKLKVKGKVFISEGLEVDNTAENRLLLESNSVKFFQKADNERKLFVPLRAKKVGMLLAMGVVGGPIAALAIQIVLNQTGLLNKMLDQHLLPNSQKTALKEGLTILAAQRENGKDVKQFMYIDRETGKINKVNMNEIQIPRKFQGVDLTPAQLHSLKEGKNITLNVGGMDLLCRLDLNEKSGIKVAGFKEFKSDREFTTVPNVNSPDVDKLKYISMRGKQGIDDIYGRGGDRLERDTFLEKYNLKEEYYKIDMAMKTGGSPMMAAGMVIKEKMSQFKDLASSLLFGIEEEQSKGQKR